MREILFRGKTEKGEWLYWDMFARATKNIDNTQSLNYDTYVVFYDDEQTPTFVIKREIGGFEYLDILPETIGQFTGLTDKNGQKVFEGDIVHYLYEPGEGYWNSDQHSVIEWESTGFYMRGIIGTNKYACYSGWLISTPHSDGKCFEVIGNIHDNKELLGE